jgi:hypothetical protein
MVNPTTDSTSRLEDGGRSDEYGSALQLIVKFAKKVRFKPISDDELAVTMEFAGPLTSGGPLFLLLQPLEDHPWSEGITGVIKQCPTWCCLKEAVYTCSAGTLNLSNVSVLDLRPFFSASSDKQLTADEINQLSELVFVAIRSKKPDNILLLSMSKVKAS